MQINELAANNKACRVLMTKGQFQLALDKLNANLAAFPEDIDSLYMTAACHRYLQQLSLAFGTLQKLLTLAPSYGRAYQELGHCLLSENKRAEAAEQFKKAVKCNPALLASWQKLLELDVSHDEQQVAESNIEYLKQLPPVLTTVLSMLNEDKLANAEQLCRSFLQQHPTHIEAMRLLAQLAEKANVLDDAEVLLQHVLKLAPNYHWAKFDLVNVLYRRQKFQPAYTLAKELFAVMPEDNSVCLTYANQLAALGEYNLAIELYKKVVDKDPASTAAWMQLGHSYKTLGQQDLAILAYHNAGKLNPSYGDPYWSLANLKTYSFSDHEIATMTSLLQQKGLPSQDAIHINFALAKAHEDAGQYKLAFNHYQLGNQQKRAQSQYSSRQMLSDFDQQKRLFDAAWIESKSSVGYPSDAPIFILGLPRSGSTLIEQILSSHSQIDGTLELPNILSYVHELNGRRNKGDDKPYPNILTSLTSKQLSDFGQRYIEETQVYRDSAPYFIDKMPNNFRHIGFIKLILPNAKIIDARRPAMSCCFSNYKQLFAEGQEFTYDLKDIAEYYQGYTELMEHWHQTFPGQLLTVDYQDMVKDTHNTIVKIFEYLNLPVEPQCFEFYKTKRAVRTASSEQVRQPINTSGLEQWQNFEPYLTELKALLNT